MLAIYKRELRSYFVGVIGYVFLVIYLTVAGALFSYTTMFSMSSDVTTYFTLMLIFCAVALPLLTMKSFSEERKTKTEQLLLSAPVTLTKDGKLTATALDGFRMANSFCVIEGNSANMEIICPARTLVEISRMLDGDENLKVYADKNLLSVAVNDTVITSRLYVGGFVKKDNIYPIDFTTRVTVKRSEMIDSVERASVLIRGDKNNLVIFDVKFGKIVINANSDMGKVEETVAADLDGKELRIAMNGKFLLDAVKALDEENIVLSFNTSVSPFTIENAGDKTCQYLVLPVRTSNPNA